MAFEFHTKCLILSLLFLSLVTNSALAARQPAFQPMPFTYHHGPLLSGRYSINLIWYGKFNPIQRAVITDFVSSLSSTHSESNPSVATWWNSIGKYYRLTNPKLTTSALSLGTQVVDETYYLGKFLTAQQISVLASRGAQQPTTAINVVLTSADVGVEGFCMSQCGTHGSTPTSSKTSKTTYIWVGNSETQCPGQCAWPFHQPIYGPQGLPLVAPNNDVGIDGMIINLASLLAGTVTNPFGNGYFQGPKDAPLEAASACPGVYGKGAYPGYAGELLVDATSGASYNANGVNGRKYLLPALYDPTSKSCSTLG